MSLEVNNGIGNCHNIHQEGTLLRLYSPEKNYADLDKD